MFIKFRSRFVGKKILLGSVVAAGLLAAQFAFAVSLAPNSNLQIMPAQDAGQVQNYGKPSGETRAMAVAGMPCAMDNTAGLRMLQNSCDTMFFNRKVGGHSSNMHAWFALMFVLTVMMVWAVLLLLIGVLWHMLKKHRKGYHIS